MVGADLGHLSADFRDPEKAMKKVLFISYFFPPIRSVESTVAINSIRYLSENGWTPFVVASKNSKKFGVDPSTIRLIPPDLDIVRTRSWENIITRVINRLDFITDATAGWWPFGLAVAKRVVQSGDITAVISRANPITSHLIAHKLTRKLFPRLPWVALFGDPWTQNPYARATNPLTKRWRENIEQRIITDADAVIVTTQLTKQLLVGKFGHSDKIHVLPNVYDPAEMSSYLLQSPSASGPLTITYAGTLYGLRSPEPLFQALTIIRDRHPEIYQNLRVNLIGAMPQFLHLVERFQLAGVVYCRGLLPREATLDHLAHSDVLLLIDAPSSTPSIFLPAKLVEYLAFDKPIVAITSPGTSADLISAARVGRAINPTDVAEIAEVIVHYYQLYQSGQLKIDADPTVVKQYTAPDYGRRLAEILDQLTSR